MVYSIICTAQIYIGPRRGATAIVHNRDVCKELKTGSNVAVNHPDMVGTIPQIARVENIPSDISMNSVINIQWYDQERAPKKSKWRRGFCLSSRYSTISVSDILLYDFEFNSNKQT